MQPPPRQAELLCPDLGRECGGYNTREGKKPASTCETLLAPGARAARGQWPNPTSRIGLRGRRFSRRGRKASN